MSDDLVKRLRGWSDMPADAWFTTMESAADRIEQLEAELVRTFNNMMAEAKLVEQLEAALRGVIAVADRDAPKFRFARAALEEKKDD